MQKIPGIWAVIFLAAFILAGCSGGGGGGGSSVSGSGNYGSYIRPSGTGSSDNNNTAQKNISVIGYISDLTDNKLFFDKEKTFGMPIENTSILFEGSGITAKSSATNSLGKFIISDVPIGTYTVTASKSGYTGVKATVTISSLGSDYVIPTSLQPAAVGTTPYTELKDGNTCQLTYDTTKNVYVMASVKDKSEGIVTGYTNPAANPNFNLIVNTGYSTYKVTAGAKSIAEHEAVNEILSGGENTECVQSFDTELRLTEQDILEGKWAQNSNNSKAPPNPIIVGTIWNKVKIIDPSSTNTNNSRYVEISTTCRAVTQNAYFFVENQYYSPALQTRLNGYASKIEAIIANNIKYFNSVNDTDANGKIIIVFTEKFRENVLGYFNSIDKYKTTTSSGFVNSNEGDIIYVSCADQGSNTDLYVLSTIAHELQHMTLFDSRYNMGASAADLWLNEALSQIAEYYSGYEAKQLADIKTLLASGGAQNYSGGKLGPVSLTWWNSSAYNNYPMGALFSRYLREQYGMGTIKRIYKTPYAGIRLVEEVTGEDFNTVFDNFAACIVLSGTGVTNDSRYNFKTLNLQQINPVTSTEILNGRNRKSGLSTFWNNQSAAALTNYEQGYTLWSFIKYSENPVSLKFEATSGNKTNASMKVFTIPKP